ncbi:MAG: tRNA (guanosine(46)-N7)-methyltransferase TrmB [Planctomycetaceae bacterium]
MQLNPPVDLRPYFLTLDDLEGKVCWKEIFGNDHPVELDVGSGRGLFLVTAGEAHPEINYLGIELDYREGRRAAKRIKKRDMPNVRVWGGDAHRAFDKHIPDDSVTAIHVYFPDPWWKRKHRRRRIFTNELVDRMRRALKPGGLVHSWTDVEEYFEVISNLMDHALQFEKLPAPEQRDPKHDMDYQTSFERKKRKAGSPIYRGLWRFQPDVPLKTEEGIR